MSVVFSIDLETTGLDPNVHGIVEFAAIMADTHHAFQPRVLHRYMRLEGLAWSEYCLELHASLIPVILALTKNGDPKVIHPNDLAYAFERWITDVGYNETKRNGAVTAKRITPSGKNFASFDKGFLDKVGCSSIYRHRTADPVMLYYNPDKHGDTLPSTDQCLELAASEGALLPTTKAAHTAVEDAWAVLDLLTFKYTGKTCYEVWKHQGA